MPAGALAVVAIEATQGLPPKGFLAPQSAGAHHAILTIADDGAKSPQKLKLSGAGQSAAGGTAAVSRPA